MCARGPPRPKSLILHPVVGALAAESLRRLKKRFRDSEERIGGGRRVDSHHLRGWQRGAGPAGVTEGHPSALARSLAVPLGCHVRETSHGNHGKLWVLLRSCEVEKEEGRTVLMWWDNFC